ncbi:alpha/beta fold hydrolase [Rhodanobacter sp. AS-Z3]|uniref:alpha/beta hydrolase n=1 Tax=Rhodanobacter sp. AS-Z3 TaxID=3031330 RepID=UPI002478D25D|nr:alpha/beta fold hydrolase [Rhodanobacter sp. AS-Z3]WEN14153.1 alpha/beta fold hydrolase [Rhodanobacter sp. AS-Z3]
MKIHRQFARLGQRHVHYRHAGSGPALLLLHQSPQNSRMWLAMIERFADRYTVIAPDTPGFGYSDALPSAQPSIADLAKATVELTDALGLQRFAVFGMHTGGLIAAQVAWLYPERVAALVVDGYAAFEPAESVVYGESYLPPFIPSWDGAHLRWLWSRMREQKYFFPWYDGRAECAMAIDPQTTASTHETVMDVLEVGDAYRAGYGAAFRYTEHAYLSQLKPPAWLLYRNGDPLMAHRSRLPKLPAHVSSGVAAGGIAGLHEYMDTILADTLAWEPAATLLAPAVEDMLWQRRIVESPVGDIACWSRAGSGRLHLHLHAPGTRPLPPAQLDAGDAAVLAVDLPGHGASAEVDVPLSLETMLVAVTAVLATMSDLLPVVIESHAAAAGYIPALIERLGQRVERVVLHRPWLLDASEQATLLAQLPNPQLDRAGGHLGEAWQWERERHLLWPWLAPTAAARRRVAAPATDEVNDNVVELLHLGARCEQLFREATPADLLVRLRRLPLPLEVDAAVEDDYQGRAALLHKQHQKEYHA